MDTNPELSKTAERPDGDQEKITKKVRISNEESIDASSRVVIEEEKAESNDNNDGAVAVRPKITVRRDCPYLGTIKRHLLDFDFEKLCSISLTNLNVYACLICGKYYQGRGKSTHAYFHSLEQGHHVFINLHNQKFYCLPDNYEVDDISLNDIKVCFKMLGSKYNMS